MEAPTLHPDEIESRLSKLESMDEAMAAMRQAIGQLNIRVAILETKEK